MPRSLLPPALPLVPAGALPALLLLSALLLAAPGTAFGGAPSFLPYPADNSNVINPYAPSDETGLLINVLQPVYRSLYGRGLSANSLPGRGGATAWGSLASSAGDGYTLAVTNLANVILRSTAAHPVFAPDDLYQVCIVAEAPLVLWAPENGPLSSLGELIRYAKAYPGQVIIAGAGSGTITHLAGLRLNFLSGTRTLYLPYMGSTAAMQAAAQGQAHAAWAYTLPEPGRSLGLRPLAVAATARHPSLPSTPTFEEERIGLFESCFFGLAMPGAASPDSRQQVSAAWQRVITNAELGANLHTLGFSPKPLIGRELNLFLEEEKARLSALLTDFSLE